MARKLFLHWLLLFIAILLLRNIDSLYHALIYAHNRDGDYHLAGNLVYLIIIVTFLAISIWRFSKPFLAFFIWASALTTALYVPHYEWPQYAWKIAHNKKLYDALIAQYQGSPKLVVLENKEIPLYVSGLNTEWLLYDESGEIVLPSATRSSEWTRRAPYALSSLSSRCTVQISNVKDHFYYIFSEC